MFNASNRAIAERAVELLTADHPQTLRQLHYRLVSCGAYDNTAKNYHRLGAIAGRLRESGRVPFGYMVDNVRSTLKPSSWSGLREFADDVRRCYRRDFWASQDSLVEIICEKDSIAGVLQPITNEFDVSLHPLRGYASLSFLHAIAETWRATKKPINAFFLGDFDASGFDIERACEQWLRKHVPDKVIVWERLAVDKRDFDLFNLVRLPVKSRDSRAAAFLREHGEHCAELDALPAAELRDRVRTAIVENIDESEWARLQAVENAERECMAKYTACW